MLLSTGYAVIVAYIFKSLCNSIDGSLLNVDVDSWFSYFSTQSNVYVYHFFTILITLLTCVTGAKSIEKANKFMMPLFLSLIHISEPTRLRRISYAVFCLKKKK